MQDTAFRQRFFSNVRHSKDSVIGSLDDDHATQDCEYLVELAANAAHIASNIRIENTGHRCDSHWFNTFPGEHYRILAGLLVELKPKNIIDIGTHTGMSSRIMLDFSSAKVDTFDIIHWKNLSTHLTEEDFESRLTQHLIDLSIEAEFDQHIDMIDNANLIFCDAPKDGVFEYEFLDLLSNTELDQQERYLVLDDIKFLNMAPLWRRIASPKFDLTSFGHWSGTGIVDISNGLILS